MTKEQNESVNKYLKEILNARYGAIGLKAQQAALGVSADGIPGPKTLAAMRNPPVRYDRYTAFATEFTEGFDEFE